MWYRTLSSPVNINLIKGLRFLSLHLSRNFKWTTRNFNIHFLSKLWWKKIAYSTSLYLVLHYFKVWNSYALSSRDGAFKISDIEEQFYNSLSLFGKVNNHCTNVITIRKREWKNQRMLFLRVFGNEPREKSLRKFIYSEIVTRRRAKIFLQIILNIINFCIFSLKAKVSLTILVPP